MSKGEPPPQWKKLAQIFALFQGQTESSLWLREIAQYGKDKLVALSAKQPTQMDPCWIAGLAMPSKQDDTLPSSACRVQHELQETNRI